MTHPQTTGEGVGEELDLRPWGYAPGYYIFKCKDCPETSTPLDWPIGDKRSWRCKEHALAEMERSGGLAFTKANIAAAHAETDRLQRELDITNADHIALWLEANITDSSLAWLACRIVEAHEAAIGIAAGTGETGTGSTVGKSLAQRDRP